MTWSLSVYLTVVQIDSKNLFCEVKMFRSVMKSVRHFDWDPLWILLYAQREVVAKLTTSPFLQIGVFYGRT